MALSPLPAEVSAAIFRNALTAARRGCCIAPNGAVAQGAAAAAGMNVYTDIYT